MRYRSRVGYCVLKRGHTGSLDPLATGLLPLCFGEATKIAGLLLDSTKAYDADVLLGTTTTTDDAEGAVLLTRPVPTLDAEMVDALIPQLIGRIRQRAPIYSALKQGVNLYMLKLGVVKWSMPRYVRLRCMRSNCFFGYAAITITCDLRFGYIYS